jgi:hypothetical protein
MTTGDEKKKNVILAQARIHPFSSGTPGSSLRRGTLAPLKNKFPLSFILPRKERGTKGVRSIDYLLTVR